MIRIRGEDPVMLLYMLLIIIHVSPQYMLGYTYMMGYIYIYTNVWDMMGYDIHICWDMMGYIVACYVGLSSVFFQWIDFTPFLRIRDLLISYDQ